MMRRPEVGDAIWWGAKQIGLHITAIRDNLVTFQGGETVRTSRGHEVPRYTVQTRAYNLHWNAAASCWLCGMGWTPPLPRHDRHTILTPLPVAVSGRPTGSFAPRSAGGV